MERTDDITGQLVVACFLIREGADHTVLNSSGQSPLEACSPEVAVIVSTFAGKYAGYCQLEYIHVHILMYILDPQ